MAFSSPAWRVAKSRVRGLRHERSGVHCEDAFYTHVREGLLIAAVADGASTAAHSATGAQCASETAVVEVGERLRDDPTPSAQHIRDALEAAFERAAQALQTTADENDLCIRDLATTLVVAVATPECVAGYQIGDGAVVVESDAEGLRALTRPDIGEYANETRFLDRSTLERAQYAYREAPCRHIALFTDGLQAVALERPDWQPFEGFFGPILRAAREQPDHVEDQLTQLLGSNKMRSRTDDDLTLVIATRIAPADPVREPD